MLNKLKRSVLFILIVVTSFFIVGMSLAASKPVSQIAEKDISIPVKAIVNGKWSGLGINIVSHWLPEIFDAQIDSVLAAGFTEIRIDIPDWDYPSDIDKDHIMVPRAVAKGGKVIWGIGNMTNDLTAVLWPNFRTEVLTQAAWAQANGVFEFQIGNEIENHIDGTTLTQAQLIANLKSLATDVQAIFTNGNVSYSCESTEILAWITAGKGDIDIIACNVYMGHGGVFDDGWKTKIDSLVSAFGSSGTYLTEFGPSWTSLDDYSTEESLQAVAITEMIDYIKASGMTRTLYFTYVDQSWFSGFGALKQDGTYRQLWSALTGTGTTVPVITEQTDETTPDTTLDTIAPNITGLSDDTTQTNSKIWVWDANEPATFRYLIDKKSGSIPTGDYSNTTTTTQSGVNGTYYIHVQAKDDAGNESGIVTVSAVMKKVNNNNTLTKTKGVT